MAQIINKKSPVIIASTRAKGFCFISVKLKGLHITKQVALLCGLKANKYVHFINDGNYWAFYVNDDPDGFKVCSDHANGGFVLYSRQLSRLFRDSVHCAKLNSRFFIVKSAALHNDCPVYEILTTSTVEKIIEKRKLMDAQKKAVLNLELPKKGKAA